MTDLAARNRADVAAVADQFVRLMRSSTKARARLLAHAEHDVEWSRQMLLKCVHNNDGPMRASEIAGCVNSDPSTVSRQVAALVREGLLERQADPDDGRASLLALTPKADAVLAEHDRIRLDHFARMLAGWSDSDLRRFAHLLARFTEDYESANREMINDRVATRPGRTGSAN
jgi:DNA-binding MarR family transcriptional regulator